MVRSGRETPADRPPRRRSRGRRSRPGIPVRAAVRRGPRRRVPGRRRSRRPARISPELRPLGPARLGGAHAGPGGHRAAALVPPDVRQRPPVRHGVGGPPVLDEHPRLRDALLRPGARLRPAARGAIREPESPRARRPLARLAPLALFVTRLTPLTSFDLLSYAAGLTPMRLGPFCVATGLGMAPAIFLTAAAGDLGWRSPWALVAGIAGIAALAGLVVLVRPVVKRGLGGWHGSASAPEGGSLLGQRDSRPLG